MSPGLANELTATITPTGVLTVWGLAAGPVVVDEGAPAAARNALINLLQQHAVATGGPVYAAARTPAGPWYMAVDPDGRCIPHDPAAFTAPLPELDPAASLAGAEAVIAAAQASPPQAMLALASDPDPAIRDRALAELSTWADDQDAVADAQLPAARLEVLSRCELAWVRAGVAANPCTDPAALADLVADPDPTVRMALAARFDLDPAVTVQLAADPDQRVRAELSRNPAATFLAAAPSSVAAASSEAVSPARPVPPLPDGEAAASPDVPEAAGGGDDLWDDDGPPAEAARPRIPRRALVAGGAALAIAALITGGYATANSFLAPAPSPAATDAPAPAAARWNGMTLPAGPDGPDDPAGPVAAGFAHTELGAAMAAAHLSVRIDPYAGPASFGPTITRQTIGGDAAALLAATSARYEEVAARSEVADGGPIPTATGQIVGWRTDGWAPDTQTTVHLLVIGDGGEGTDYAIAVAWADGDYALIDPTRPGTFTTGAAGDPTSYRSFR